MMKATVYLSAAGDDRNDGTKRNPVASLARAVALSRLLPSGTQRRIAVGDGRYFNTEVSLDARDSGLELVAARGACPAFYGGAPVNGWKPEGGGSPFWVADIPGVREGSRDFRVLVVNGRLAERARFPKTGAIRHASEFPVNWMSTTKGGWERKPTEAELNTLRLVPGSLPESLSTRNAELTIYHCWDDSLVGIRSWDRAAGTIAFSTPAGHPPGAFGGWKEQARTFVVWNVREGMTHPGQWFLDREQGRVVYWPLGNEEADLAADQLDTLAPYASTVLRLDGTAEMPVHDITVKGITFGATTTPLLAGGFGALKFAGALDGQYVHGLRLDRVTVRWSGGQGIRVLHTNGMRCRNCTVHDVGAGGIVVSGGDGSISHTLIHHNGRIYPSSLGMRVSGERWRVRRNTLHHTPYSAVNAGGSRLHFERNSEPVPLLPRCTGSLAADLHCRCEDGKVTFGNSRLAAQLGIRGLDVSRAGCGRE